MADVCRALALSGGANNGAWEVGVLWGLLHYGNPEDFAWQVISGISAGSINTAAASVWKVGDEYAMTEWLSDEWANLTSSTVWTYWGDGPAGDIFKHAGVVNNAPLKEFIKDTIAEFPDGIQRAFFI